MYKYINNEKDLEEVGEKIKEGKIVIFPTETVYAIGTNGLDANAVKKLYDIKKRDYKNPINLLVNNINMIEKITQNITELEYKLMEKFFPGPFTIILNKKDIVPDIVTAGKNKVGVRVPDNKIALEIISKAGVPISAPSANISGRPSGTNFDDIKLDFVEDIDYIVDGGECKIGLESTIVEVIDNVLHILRPGAVTYDDILKITPNIEKDYEQNNKLLPSQKLKHYSLNCESVLIYGNNNEKVISRINDEIKKYNNAVVFCLEEDVNKIDSKNVISMGTKENLEEISKNLFKNLRKINQLNPKIVLIKGIEERGLAVAIMNRLKNVCKDNVVEVK